MGGNTKLSKVMVVAPMRSRMSSKFGTEREIARSANMIPDRWSALLYVEPEMMEINLLLTGMMFWFFFDYLMVFWKPPQSRGMKDSEAWAARWSNVSRTALRLWFLPKKGTFRTAFYLVLSFIEEGLPVHHTARTRHSGPPCPQGTTSPSLTSGGKEQGKLRFEGNKSNFQLLMLLLT